MKSIIVAIEFPLETRDVINVAKKYAKEFEAKLYVIHSETVESYISHSVSEDNQQFNSNLMKEYKDKFEMLMHELQEELSAENIVSECILAEGLTVDCILKTAQQVKAELIVLGSHEHGKFYHLIFGSIHDLIINKSTLPILIVPPHIKN